MALLAGLCIGLLFGGLAVGVALGGIMPLPYGPAAPIQHYVQTQPLALHIIAVAVFGSSVLLALYAAVVGSRLRELGVMDAGPTVVVVSGTLAAGSLAVTGLLGWTLSRPEVVGDPALVRALYYLTFLVGGPGHVAALGALIAGITAGGVLPRTGIAIAALCALATLVLAWTALGPILPVARVGLRWPGCWWLALGLRHAAVTQPCRLDLGILPTLARDLHSRRYRRSLDVNLITLDGRLHADSRCVARQRRRGGDDQPRRDGC